MAYELEPAHGCTTLPAPRLPVRPRYLRGQRQVLASSEPAAEGFEVVCVPGGWHWAEGAGCVAFELVAQRNEAKLPGLVAGETSAVVARCRDGLGDRQTQRRGVERKAGIAAERPIGAIGAEMVATGRDTVRVCAIALGAAHQAAMQFAAGMKGQYAMATHMGAGSAVECVSADDALVRARARGQAGRIGTQAGSSSSELTATRSACAIRRPRWPLPAHHSRTGVVAAGMWRVKASICMRLRPGIPWSKRASQAGRLRAGNSATRQVSVRLASAGR